MASPKASAGAAMSAHLAFLGGLLASRPTAKRAIAAAVSSGALTALVRLAVETSGCPAALELLSTVAEAAPAGATAATAAATTAAPAAPGLPAAAGAATSGSPAANPRTAAAAVQLHEAACELVQRIAAERDNREALRATQLLLPALTAMARHAPQQPAHTATLLYLAQQDSLALALKDAGVLGALEALLDGPGLPAATRVRALLVLAHVCGSDGGPEGAVVQRLLSRHSAARIVVRLAESAVRREDGALGLQLDEVLHAAAALAGGSEDAARGLAAAGLLPLLLGVLRSKSMCSDAVVVLRCCAALLNMAAVGELQATLLSAGVVEAVRALLEAAQLAADPHPAQVLDTARALLLQLGGLSEEAAQSAADRSTRPALQSAAGSGEGTAGTSTPLQPPQAGSGSPATAAAAASAFDVFLSHKRTDAKDFARALYNLLVTRGISTFLDFEYREELSRLDDIVARCTNFVFILTDHVFESEWCRRELQAAAQAGVNIVLVVKEGSRWRDAKGNKVCEFPPYELLRTLPADAQKVFERKSVQHSDEYYAFPDGQDVQQQQHPTLHHQQQEQQQQQQQQQSPAGASEPPSGGAEAAMGTRQLQGAREPGRGSVRDQVVRAVRAELSALEARLEARLEATVEQRVAAALAHGGAAAESGALTELALARQLSQRLAVAEASAQQLATLVQQMQAANAELVSTVASLTSGLAAAPSGQRQRGHPSPLQQPAGSAEAPSLEGAAPGAAGHWLYGSGRPDVCGNPFQGTTDKNFTDPSLWFDGFKANWTSGQAVDVTIYLSTNHGGRMAMRLCPLDRFSITPACFEQPQNQLRRVAPGTKYDGKVYWYLKSGDVTITQTFRLPAGVTCVNGCVLQWWWVGYQNCYLPCASPADDVEGECGVSVNGSGQCDSITRTEQFNNCAAHCLNFQVPRLAAAAASTALGAGLELPCQECAGSVSNGWDCHNCFNTAKSKDVLFACLSCARAGGGGPCSQNCAARATTKAAMGGCTDCARRSGNPWACEQCFVKSAGDAGRRDVCLTCSAGRLDGYACGECAGRSGSACEAEQCVACLRAGRDAYGCYTARYSSTACTGAAATGGRRMI
ncbi:hypothetical protein GPECTOR_10g1108 [Gonium pectorale]|uniref:TIR domain-containing protein n=1 Tax=Gonium pectorale TaxID=33097 RepID=A0A150GQI4_GONPE|nr:hypothetical protein GPECTOR_10g1108 [Gonium pectorale]|eukprot:KXZ52085.1 hypothetical protein GPECTOR_10g1108 [Gonium pectorale]